MIAEGQHYPHGERRGYDRGCRCPDCRKANAEIARRQRDKRKKYREDQIPHGYGGYVNYGCRCPICSEANRDKMQEGLDDRRSRPDEVPHGTASGYRFWECRCPQCVDAFRYKAEEVARKRYEESLRGAHRSGNMWTGPELELVSRDDLSARELAKMLGRTYYAVLTRRGLLKNPMPDHIAGVSRRES